MSAPLADRREDYIEAQRAIRTAFHAVDRLPSGEDPAGMLLEAQAKLEEASDLLREWYDGPSSPPHPGASSTCAQADEAREPEAPAYLCSQCDCVVTCGGWREDRAEFEDADDLPRQDPPVECGWHDEVGTVERCEVCENPWGDSWWPGAGPPLHPGGGTGR